MKNFHYVMNPSFNKLKVTIALELKLIQYRKSMLKFQETMTNHAEIFLSRREKDTADQMRLRLETPFPLIDFFMGLTLIESSYPLQASLTHGGNRPQIQS